MTTDLCAGVGGKIPVSQSIAHYAKWKSRTQADTDSDADSDSDSDSDTNTAKSGKGRHRQILLHNINTKPGNFDIQSPKTVQSLPHPVAIINFLFDHNSQDQN